MEGKNDRKALKTYTILSKDNSWFAKVGSKEKDKLLNERAIESKGERKNTYQTLFTEKELYDYVEKRDNYSCFFCKRKRSHVDWLLKGAEGGLETPVNLVNICNKCSENLDKDKIKSIRDANKLKITEWFEKKLNCDNCEREKQMKDLKYISANENLAYCETCVQGMKSDVYFLINEKNNFTGIGTKEYIAELFKEGKVDYISSKVAKLFDEEKKKECVICNNMKWKNAFKKTSKGERKLFCKKCEREKRYDGLITLCNHKGKKIERISTDKMKRMLKKGIIKKINKGEFKTNKLIDTYLYKIKKIIDKRIKNNKQYFTVSISGKWSADVSEETKEQLIKEGLAQPLDDNIIRLVYDIEGFKKEIMERDNYLCRFCGKKGTGVFSESRIRMYSNSYCTCLDCEYIHVPNKILKWLNVQEEKRKLITRSKIKTVWLYEKNKLHKYRIDKNASKILIKGKIAKKTGRRKVELLYSPKEFRVHILERDKRKCHYCGANGGTIDHVKPKSKGGLTTLENCVCACGHCNSQKGSMNKKEFINLLKEK